MAVAVRDRGAQGDRTLSAFAFHAAPPPGTWMNDRNALLLRDGRWQLLAQHSASPATLAIGWGHWSSADLLG